MKQFRVACLIGTLLSLTGCAWIMNLIDQRPTASFTVVLSSGAVVGSEITLDASAGSDPQGYSLEYR